MGALADTALALEFPSLDRDGVVYLDSGATSQTPRAVIAAMDDYYEHHRASVHRGVYPLAAEATELFESARERIAAFVNWPARDSIFTKNVTEALNLVAYAWGDANLGPGDRVVVTEMEHHSSIVPWQLACARTGATFDWIGIDDDGRLRLDELDAKLAGGDVKVVAVTHVSNVLGTINPVADIVRRARAAGAITVVDGAQSVPQIPVDLAAIDADFYAWTGHKAYGPTGVGVLHGRHELLSTMPPFLGGGHMIASVSLSDGSRWGEVPSRFEAGTSNIAEAIGLGAAVDFLDAIGMEQVRVHEQALVAYALERLRRRRGRHAARPGRSRRARRRRLVRRRGHPPARRRRDPRAPGRVRARRPPLRPAAHAAPGRRAPRRARPSACTTPRRTSTRSSTALAEAQRIFA